MCIDKNLQNNNEKYDVKNRDLIEKSDKIIGDIDELIFPDDEQKYVSER